MRVALITFHNTLNYGAALQAYASQQAIKALGVDCEIIDYVNEHRKNAYSMMNHAMEELKKKRIASSAKYFLGGVFMSTRRRRFLNFYRNNLVCTKQQFTSSQEAKILNNEFDKFVVGSDQVWNYNHNGNDFAYLLDFVEDNDKKISYASSFGLADIPEDLKGKYIENLRNIRYLSTRERYGVELIKRLVGREAKLVLDPVFLLNKDQWLSLCKNREKKRSYVFSYTNRPEQWEDFLKKTNFPMENLKVYKISRHLTIKDFLSPKVKVKYSISPNEFIETIANAKLVVSASFHCIAMSIILNVPFVAILTGDKGKDERILNLLRITGLEDRILNDHMTCKDVHKNIDFKLVESRISKYIDDSLDFLKTSILS